MSSINPYLIFNDSCEEAFNFYQSVFGGEFGRVMRFSDVPDNPFKDQPQKIMHIELPIGRHTSLMGADTPGIYGEVKAGTNFHISLQVDSEEEADKVFKGLSAGGKVVMPMDHAFWGSYFGMLADKYEVEWMISYAKPQ